MQVQLTFECMALAGWADLYTWHLTQGLKDAQKAVTLQPKSVEGYAQQVCMVQC